MAAEWLRADQVAAMRGRAEACLPGPWLWNSYSNIEALVPTGHPWDVCGPDEVLLGGDGLAHITYIAQAPAHQGHGDELHSAQARAHAAFIEHARVDVPALCTQDAAWRALVGELLTFAEKYAQHAPSWCKAGDWRADHPCTCGLQASESVLAQAQAALADAPPVPRGAAE